MVMEVMKNMMTMNQKNIRTYTELMNLNTYEERINYLRLYGDVGRDTFGFDRYLNQMFYTSKEWRILRNNIITRDNGCDLAIPDLEIPDRIYIHHMNPLTKDDIINKTEFLLNPEFLICTSKFTHDFIHYGNGSINEYQKPITRTKNDTCPWRH